MEQEHETVRLAFNNQLKNAILAVLGDGLFSQEIAKINATLDIAVYLGLTDLEIKLSYKELIKAKADFTKMIENSDKDE